MNNHVPCMFEEVYVFVHGDRLIDVYTPNIIYIMTGNINTCKANYFNIVLQKK